MSLSEFQTQVRDALLEIVPDAQVREKTTRFDDAVERVVIVAFGDSEVWLYEDEAGLVTPREAWTAYDLEAFETLEEAAEALCEDVGGLVRR